MKIEFEGVERIIPLDPDWKPEPGVLMQITVREIEDKLAVDIRALVETPDQRDNYLESVRAITNALCTNPVVAHVMHEVSCSALSKVATELGKRIREGLMVVLSSGGVEAQKAGN